MNLMNIFIRTGVLALFILISSFKDSSDITISIRKPLATDIFGFGDTVRLKIDIKSGENASPLHDVEISVVDSISQFQVYLDRKHTHSSQLNIDAFYVNTLKYESVQTLRVVLKNHDGSILQKAERSFKIRGKK